MNMTKRDILELRRRLTKKGCSFTRMSGCYVGGTKNIVTKFSQPFLDLEDDEFFKYLEIAKKVLSGTPGGNLLELSIGTTESAVESQQFLFALKESKLKNDGLLDRLYEQIIDHYDTPVNYLILVFHDIYDVPVRAQDQAKLDESEEVYEYLLCALCPVELSKPGIGYYEEDNCFGPRVRDWVVGLPELGFVYPAFIQRSADTNAVMYYVKTGKPSQPMLIQQVLGCGIQRTASEEKSAFQDIVMQAFGTEKEQAENAFVQIQKNLSELVATRDEESLPPLEMRAETVQDVLADIPMPDTVKEQITQSFSDTFGVLPPCAQNLIDNKLVAIGIQREQTLALTNKIETLEQQLAEQAAEQADTQAPADETQPDSDTADTPDDAADTSAEIVLQVPAGKAERIQAQVINGQKCLVIPVEDGEAARINGVAAPL